MLCRYLQRINGDQGEVGDTGNKGPVVRPLIGLLKGKSPNKSTMLCLYLQCCFDIENVVSISATPWLCRYLQRRGVDICNAVTISAMLCRYLQRRGVDICNAVSISAMLCRYLQSCVDICNPVSISALFMHQYSCISCFILPCNDLFMGSSKGMILLSLWVISEGGNGIGD